MISNQSDPYILQGAKSPLYGAKKREALKGRGRHPESAPSPPVFGLSRVPGLGFRV